MDAAVDLKKNTKVAIGWLILLLAVGGTFALTKKIQSTENVAAAFLGKGSLHTIYLYEDRVEPAEISARPKDEIVFMVLDDSRHNMAEHRSSQRDARLESGEFGAGESYSLIFANPGNYSFYDRMDQDIEVNITIK